MLITMTTSDKPRPESKGMFGHHGIGSHGCFIDAWGSGPLLIRWKGREWWFEFSDMFGPTLLRKSDKEPADTQPTREDHPFWEPFNRWFKAGKKCRAIRGKRKHDYRVRYWVCHVPRDERLP